MDGGAWWAAVHEAAKSRTWLSDFTFTFHFHALEKEVAAHSSVLAWRIPGMGESDGLPSMGSHRVGHDWSHLAAAAAASPVLLLKVHWKILIEPDSWVVGPLCLDHHNLLEMTFHLENCWLPLGNCRWVGNCLIPSLSFTHTVGYLIITFSNI